MSLQPPLALRLLVHLFPRRFRDRYGEDMAACFLARRTEARAAGAFAVVRLWLRTAASLAGSAIAERWRSSLDAAPRRARRPMRHGGGLVDGLWHDVHIARRLMRRRPLYALFVALTLAVGIGANTAVFSVVSGVLLRPLPYPRADRLLAVWTYFRPESGFDFPVFALSPPEYLDYRDATQKLSGLAAASASTGSVNVGSPGAEPERLAAARVTANLFDVLDARPLVGRTFARAEDRPGGPAVAVISYGLWRDRFAGDPSVLGRTITIDGVATEIVGVMPASFAYPSRAMRLWRPLAIDEANPGNRRSHYLLAIGRLADAATTDGARAELDGLMAAWRADDPKEYTGHGIWLRPLREQIVGDSERAILLLFAATGLLLLIVCANVASVVMARGEGRTREMAIRHALGASRWRLARLTLVESLLLAGAGGLAGVGLATVGLRALLALAGTSLPRASEVTVDGRVLLFAAATSVTCAVLVGLVPALRGSTPDPQATLLADARTVSQAVRRFRMRALVAAEVALVVVLVVGAGLLARSLDRLLAVDPGFRADRVLVANVALPAAGYAEATRVWRFFDALLARVRAAPGVEAASATTDVPLQGNSGFWDFEIDGRTSPASGEAAWNAAFAVRRPDFLKTLGIPLLRGRDLSEDDGATAPPVVVINETLARKFFPGQDPIGRRLRRKATPPYPWMTIVGVQADVRDTALDSPPKPMYAAPLAQAPASAGRTPRSLTVVVRTAGEPGAVLPAVRAAVRELDPALPVYAVRTLDAVVAGSVARPRFVAALFGTFALLGLVLGASGIYGVLAYTVACRAREIGIRRALGATSGPVARLVVMQGMAPVLVGLAVGLLASSWASRLLSRLLYETSPSDPATLATVAIGVLLLALAACAVPTRRALAVSPILAISGE